MIDFASSIHGSGSANSTSTKSGGLIDFATSLRSAPSTPAPKPQQMTNGYPSASIVKDVPQGPQSIFQQATNLFNTGKQAVTEAAKQVIDFIPKAPTVAKNAIQHPDTTIAGGGSAVLQTFGAAAGLVENGIASALHVTVPDRWNVTKQVQALPQLDQSLIRRDAKSARDLVEQKNAYAVGNFIGTALPYALGSEVSGATLGAKVLVPTAEKFLPGAVKFAPAISNAISFLGIGQITHNDETGTRVEQFKNDLIMLSLFEVGGVVTKGLSKGTKGLISKAIDDVKGQKVVDMQSTLPVVNQAKQAIQQDLGKPMPVAVTQEIASGQLPHTATAPEVVTVPEVIKPIGEGKVAPSKLGLRVEQTAIEKKIVAEVGGLPEYQRMDMKAQAQKAGDLLRSDPQKAMDIALGKSPAPDGIAKESIFKAVESSITTPEQAIELARSPLVSEATALGQRIKALDVRTTDSPVEAINQVIKGRQQALEKSGKSVTQITTATIKDIKQSIEKAKPNKKDWALFIKEIQCK